MRYRRSRSPGATYFFTLNLADRNRTLLADHAEMFREVIDKVRQKHPFQIDAMVVLPDHLHALWTLPEDDSDYMTRWMLIKTGFSRNIPKGEYRSDSRKSKGERGIWQRRYWEHLIRNDLDNERHVDYIHFNPVKHGYVSKALEWKYSSIHRYVESGIVAPDWGMNEESVENYEFGEK